MRWYPDGHRVSRELPWSYHGYFVNQLYVECRSTLDTKSVNCGD